MRRKVWPFSFTAVLDDFMRIPDCLNNCINNYFKPQTHEFFSQIRKMLDSLSFSRVLFIGNTFNYFASLIPLYILNETSEPLDFSWQSFETSEFNDYILPDEPDKNTLYIFISKSGKSRFFKNAITRLSKLKIDKNLIWLITNEPKLGSVDNFGAIFPIYVDSEMVLGSKSYPNMVFVLFLITQLLIGKNPLSDEFKIILDNLIYEMQEFKRKREHIIIKILDFFDTDFDFIYYISKGASLSSAFASALAAKSFGRLFAEGLSLGLFFYGPFQIADEKYRFILIMGDSSEDPNIFNEESLLLRLINRITKKLGSKKVLLLSNNNKLSSEMKNNPNVYVVDFKCKISALSPIFEMFILHLINLEIAEKKLDILL